MKRCFAVVGLVAAAVLLVGCSDSSSRSAISAPTTPAQSTPAATPTPKSSVQAWQGVTDGTWDWGDVALGQPVSARLSDYTITITEVPTLTTEDDGATVKITSPLTITRTGDQDLGRDITDSERIFFVPGNYGYPQHDEAYGVHPDFECASEQLAVGQAAECSVSFKAPSEEIQDSYWQVNGQNAAAWPSQVP